MQNPQHTIASSNPHSLLSDEGASRNSRPRAILPLPAPKQQVYHGHPGAAAAPSDASAVSGAHANTGGNGNVNGNGNGNGNNGGNNASILKPKQKRYRANPDQLRHLINLFNINPSPTASELTNLSVRINMPTQSVILWFKNRRARVPHKKAEKERRAAVAKAEKVASTGASSSSMGAPKSSSSSQYPNTITNTNNVNTSQRLPASANSAMDTAAALVLADMASSHQKNSGNNMPRDLAMLCSAAAVQQQQQQQQHVTTRAYLPPLPPPLPPINNMNSETKANRNNTNNAIPASKYPLVPALPGGLRLTVPANYYTSSNISNTGSVRSSLPPPPPTSQSIPMSISTSTCAPTRTMPLAPAAILPPQGAPVAANNATPRRPRGAHFSPGENVEVLIYSNANSNNPAAPGDTYTGDDKNKFWMPATIVDKCTSSNGSDPKELHLGASIVNHSSHANISTNSTTKSQASQASQASSSDGERDDDDDKNTNTESPRTVQSPAASGSDTRNNNNSNKQHVKKYIVKFSSFNGNNNKAQEEVGTGRIRPQPPVIEWKYPQAEDAVEAHIHGGWKVGTMKEYNATKKDMNMWGVMIEGERELQWMRKEELRAHQVWRGGNEWVEKLKISRTRSIGENDINDYNDDNDGKDGNKENILLLGKRSANPSATNVNVNVNGGTEGMETRRKRFRKK